ncbi:RNA polymerase sigma factor (sigma-70 family) [Arthrobacter sp. UYP6]|uniref:RNA polymerase sigma factor n=1 Tax=Arthrobacter sp. UYP6 TaxID=1756378 RepID=UPI003397F738
MSSRVEKPLVSADDQLAVNLAQGSEAAFAALFDKYSGTVYRYAWGLADARHEVPDIVQETFLLLWRRRKDVRLAERTVLPWLLLCCRNTAYNLNRAQRRSVPTELTDPLPGSPAWNQRADHTRAAEELAWILEEISALPDIERKLCELCLIEGRSYDEAAATLGISQPAARKRIERARRKLRAARTTNL